MRLALIGPSNGNQAALRQRATSALETLNVDKAVYLGVDSHLDAVVQSWATEIIQGDPSDAAVWQRAAETCGQAPHEELDKFVATERKRQRLQALVCLADTDTRSIEFFGDLVVVLIHDKAKLDEEDIRSATVLVFGNSPEPIIRQVGSRLFVSPGPISHPDGGLALIAEDGAQLVVSIHAADGRVFDQKVAATLEANS